MVVYRQLPTIKNTIIWIVWLIKCLLFESPLWSSIRIPIVYRNLMLLISSSASFHKCRRSTRGSPSLNDGLSSKYTYVYLLLGPPAKSLSSYRKDTQLFISYFNVLTSNTSFQYLSLHAMSVIACYSYMLWRYSTFHSLSQYLCFTHLL